MKRANDLILSRKVFRKGTSLVVSIPCEMLELLGQKRGSQVSVDLDRLNRCVVIRLPGQLATARFDTEFNHQLAEFDDVYRQVLNRLARKQTDS